MIDPELMLLSDEVESAIANHRPLVALESTVIAHGLPRPQNLDTARRLTHIVRESGATPATIAIINGQVRVGLNDEQLRLIAESDDIKKITLRDLPVAIAHGWNGATTVATTAWIAHRTGIRVFATGGIGGVHRGALPDISADLPVIARTPVVVVCSGAKIVLDLPATREWLETQGVTVLGYQCNEMPAFYSRTSGLPVDTSVDSPDEVAQIVKAQASLGIESALIVTVPVPKEAEVDKESLKKVLGESLRQAEEEHVGGRDVTPFLLSRMSSLSQGATLRANLALLENNAVVASKIAAVLARDRGN